MLLYYELAKGDHGLPRDPYKSCVTPRPIAWLSTVSPEGIANLAPFSQFTALGFDPPYILLSFNQHPVTGGRKDTVNNIERTGDFVFNMVSYELREKMNITAAPFPTEIDEFEAAGLTKAPSVLVKSCRVAESPVQMECKYVQTIRLPGGGKIGTVDVIIAEAVGLHIKDEFIMPDGKLDMEKIRPLGRMGYSDYCVIDSVFEMQASKAAGDLGNLSSGLEGSSTK